MIYSQSRSYHLSSILCHHCPDFKIASVTSYAIVVTAFHLYRLEPNFPKLQLRVDHLSLLLIQPLFGMLHIRERAEALAMGMMRESADYAKAEVVDCNCEVK